ncbi:Rne/Rng family ribonuclease [Brevibacterium daeguense]|uniref:Rne/Rng family ribonuclease n=1 Tax=Brevibacterium daeguense TaxID=909936 RepID=A0ABP8EJ96_9MICO|nr:Rne/Rng family ribonuclease [Brevibacterium daeguense]
MTNTPDDPQDPTAAILADLESLRASRERQQAERAVDEDVRAQLDSIAQAAESLREPAESQQESPESRSAEAGQEVDAPEPRAARSAVANRGLIFESAISRSTRDREAGAAEDSRDDSQPMAARHEAPSPQVDPRNPFAFNRFRSAEEEPVAFAPAAIPAGGGLLFQPPQAELAEQVDPDWSAEDDYDDEEDYFSADGDDSGYGESDSQSDESDAAEGTGSESGLGSEDSAQDGDAEAQPRRRRRGGRGRRSRSRDQRDSSSGDDEQGDTGSGREAHRETGAEASNDDRRSGGPKSSDQHGARESDDSDSAQGSAEDSSDSDDSGSSRRRRRRRSRGSNGSQSSAGAQSAAGAQQSAGSDDNQVTGVKGSTRLEAKRQRRREGREAGRRRPIITEAEFLARRESVERTMLVREQDGRTQLVVLEDGIAVEHYLSEAKAHASLIGNVYLGRVQNVLPSMEAAFVDIGKGRNAVLYAGEVNWDALGMEGKPRRIELALNAGDPVLVQVTKDPVGHKGARLTAQVSLPGRFLVYVPGASMTGISRKLPENERQRLKKVLRTLVPDSAGVIVRTAAEGASETELERDVERLSKRWESIEKKSTSTKVQAPQLLYSEPDMTVRIIRDVFNEDFSALVVDGDSAWDTIHEYVEAVAPDLLDRVRRHDSDADLFDEYRVSEQIEKALDRQVALPSGGSLVIDRTEAMTVIDVNTGKFTGSGGNLEETVTKNNLEAAEEVIRQLRLRDIGGIIVVDFIDMVLESNRDLVLRRLIECLGRDRTKHQVAEVTSLGLVQMTRKRIGTGLAESLVQAGEDLSGRGLLLPGTEPDQSGQGGSRSGRGRRRQQDNRRRPAVDDDKQDVSRSAVAAIAKATLKKDEPQTPAPPEDSAAEQGTAPESAQSTDQQPSDDAADSAEQQKRDGQGRTGRSRRGSRGRRSERAQAAATAGPTDATDSTDAPERESKAAITAPEAAERAEVDRSDSKAEIAEPATARPAPSAPPEPSGPAPLIIGADSETKVQVVAPTEEPAVAEPDHADSEPASAADRSTGSEEPASDDAASDDTRPVTEEKPREPAPPILMLGMDS